MIYWLAPGVYHLCVEFMVACVILSVCLIL